MDDKEKIQADAGPVAPAAPPASAAGVAVIGVAVCGMRTPQPKVSAGAGVAIAPLTIGGQIKDVGQ